MTTRREFMKVMASASLASSILGGAEHTAGGETVLEPLDYSGVRLLDGRLRRQYLATRDFYYNIPDDDVLKGFRKNAGLPAPGQDMGGWCSKDCSVVFGQWLSGMARMYKATGDVAMRDKATHLMRE
jgi:hypothetical protein